MTANVLATTLMQIQQDQSGQLFRGRVDEVNGNEVYIIRDGATGRDDSSYPVLDGVSLVAGDYVVLARIGTRYVVTGRIIHNNTTPSRLTAGIVGGQVLGLPSPNATLESVVIDADTTFNKGLYFFKDFYLSEGVVLTLDRGTVVIVEGNAELYGEIDGDGYGGGTGTASPFYSWGGNIIPATKDLTQNFLSALRGLEGYDTTISGTNYAYVIQTYMSMAADLYGGGGDSASSVHQNGTAGGDWGDNAGDGTIYPSTFFGLLRELIQYGGAGFYDSGSNKGGVGGGGGGKGTATAYGSPTTSGSGGVGGGAGFVGNNGRAGGGGSGFGGGGGAGCGDTGVSGGTVGTPGFGGTAFFLYSNSLRIGSAAYIHCNGTDAEDSTGEASGSGGGGGGAALLGYHTLVENLGTIEALGGAGGQAGGTQGDGAAGGDGPAGLVEIPIAA